MSTANENRDHSDGDSSFEGFMESDILGDVSDTDVGDISVSDIESSDDEVSDDDMNWTDRFDNNFDVNDFLEETGPQLPPEFDVHTASPLDYFYLLFPVTLLIDIVGHTNNYAMWKMEQSGENDPKWTGTTLEEMAAYIGLNIFMGIDSKPHYNMYLSMDDFNGNACFKKTMTCNQYEKITQYFHVADRQSEPGRGSPNYDRLFKIQPIMNVVKDTFYRFFKPNRELAIDEGMIKFAGRNSIKQYMPAKPVKRGVKVWMRCDSKTAYLTKFNFYLGKSDKQKY
ncbi:piggyBac transposable element-derived protein 4-like [Gigantopelta aegis]|uniref:piggyBac transposable element-derived protein 4-like n=1 Tax=Gigantopelta aegis TaxID=1735272 RepID=UPI001B88CFCE|nr:piggyBac transposable element-derived protein 4-like [Gigantopelta aegis]